VAVLPGEHAAAERRPRQDAQTRVVGRVDDLALDAALQQRVLHLRRHEPRGPGSRRLHRRGLGGLPPGVVADADVAHLAGGHRGVERRERLVERGCGVPGVQLPEVDVVDAEATQRRVESREQVAS
jgi:hypothetical protein